MSGVVLMGQRGADPTGTPPNQRVRVSASSGGDALGTGHARLTVVATFFEIAFAIVAGRIIDLSAFNDDRGTGTSASVATGQSVRGDIVDRNGVVLASSLAVASLYAEPRRIADPALATEALMAVLPTLDHGQVFEKLSTGKSFVWLQRHLTPSQQMAVNALGVPGLGFRTEQRRVYPHGALAAHVVGYAGIDNHGLGGIEQYFDADLLGGGGQVSALELSIDVRTQYALQEELALALEEFQAIGAAGLVLDARTGEIIAMVSLPNFDPNQIGTSLADGRFNRASLGVYELGSTLKILTIAMALEFGTATLESEFDATEPLRVGRFTIRDDHPESRWLSVPEIFIHSSNIGAARMAMEVGADRQQEFLNRMGLMSRAGVQLPEVGTPIVPKPWRDTSTMTVAFGHGIAVSPLQFAGAVAATINGGWAVPPTLIKSQGPVDRQRVLSGETSEAIRRLLRLNVLEGTGTLAAAPGFLVGGKTGTAEKARGGGYQSDALVSSFVGAFPMNDPRYVVLALLDEPQGNDSTKGFATAGWTAAPVVSRVISRIGPLLGVEPVDTISRTAQQALFISLDGRTAGAAF
ncbi:MAG: penicillin-binding protein 2 [Alphaproteobacteria bacterium]|nr:penicillin-binding protein 2 [Alphaproteobacteria bacterium]